MAVSLRFGSATLASGEWWLFLAEWIVCLMHRYAGAHSLDGDAVQGAFTEGETVAGELSRMHNSCFITVQC